jgi:hypothetical protein
MGYACGLGEPGIARDGVIEQTGAEDERLGRGQRYRDFLAAPAAGIGAQPDLALEGVEAIA